ncbi:MAG: hypothetical protein IH866_04955 [Chloroflexi bacterium]|nr:hypothetical protein [Chloroflexota bacterium]
MNATLNKLGATMADLVDETVFVTDIAAVMSDIEKFGNVREEAYGGRPQVRQTLPQVASLVFPTLMIEIRCVAIFSDYAEAEEAKLLQAEGAASEPKLSPGVAKQLQS